MASISSSVGPSVHNPSSEIWAAIETTRLRPQCTSNHGSFTSSPYLASCTWVWSCSSIPVLRVSLYNFANSVSLCGWSWSQITPSVNLFSAMNLRIASIFTLCTVPVGWLLIITDAPLWLTMRKHSKWHLPDWERCVAGDDVHFELAFADSLQLLASASQSLLKLNANIINRWHHSIIVTSILTVLTQLYR